MKRQRIAVVGGSGFLGRVLVRRLRAQGHDAWIVDRRRSEAHPHLTRLADVRVPRQLLEACRGSEVIYNLAAEHRDDVSPSMLYYDVNVEGAECVCRAASQLDVQQIVFTSTVAVYGFPSGEVNEDAQPKPFNHYGRSKLQAEGVYRNWRQLRGQRSLVIVRPTVVFGEGNQGNLHQLINQIDKGRFAMVGSGGNVKSLAHVENVTAFLDFVRGLGAGEHLFNYADKPDLCVSELVKLIHQELGRPLDPRLRMPYSLAYVAGAACDLAACLTRRNLPLSRVRVRKFCANTQFSAAKAAATGFQPPIDLRQGIASFIAGDFGQQGGRRAA